MASIAPSVSPHQWIQVEKSIAGYVIRVNSDGSLEIGYNQHGIKAIKETVVWSGAEWKFKYEGPNGSYLRGSLEAVVKRGPRG